jgi:PAS domain S-box-containing protein
VKPLKSSPVLVYGYSAVCVIIGLLIRSGLGPLLHDEAPLGVFALTAMVATYFGGVGPGIVAMVGGVLAGDFYFVPPSYALGPASEAEWVQCIKFLVATGTAIALIEAWQRTRRGKRKPTLEARLDELHSAQEALRKQNEELAASRRALENERSRYWELFNSAPIGYIITSAQGIIQQVNLAAAGMLNETPNFLAGLPLAGLLPRECRRAFFDNLGRLARRETEQIANWETLVQPHDRPAFEASVLVNRVEDERRRLTGLRWILRDVTDRKQAEQKILRLNAELEQRVQERTAALESANREMEAFSYSVSHDLRAPLRSIIGFSNALVEDYSDKLDPEGARYLQYTHEAGLKMNRLVNDLMELSRATRGVLHQEEVDLSALATVLINELRERDPHRMVEALIEPGLVARGDEGLLRIALENLLSNAWKFTAQQTRARIEVGTSCQKGSRVFFVRDNGAGFSMAHAGRLFGVFQRLHSEQEFPGTGIGLATVRRIFTRHGGQVWAEAKIGEGATFYFSLPEVQSPDAVCAQGEEAQPLTAAMEASRPAVAQGSAATR